MVWLKRLAVWGSFTIFGALAGAAATAYGFERFFIRATSDLNSQQAGMTAIVLGDLRLGNEDGAIKQLEAQLDGSLAGVYSSEQNGGCRPGDNAIPWLSGAKVYRTAYPSTRPWAGVPELLNEIRMPNPDPHCDNSICRIQRKMAQPTTQNTN